MDAPVTNLYLCLDQGGHASRAIVFDDRGELHASAFSDIDTIRNGDHVEHDPRQLVDSLRVAATEALTRLGSSADCLRAAGLATQRSSIVCWERDSGIALSPVISWQDTRARDWLQQFSVHEQRIHSLTGLVLSPHYGASKLRWCLDNIPAVGAALIEGNLVAGPLATYLARHLTGNDAAMADPANASRTLLWDRRSRDWSDELTQLFAVPRDCLPLAVPSRHNWGVVDLGDTRLPLEVVTGDQSAALFAFGAVDELTVFANLGTGAFLQRRADDAAEPGRLLSSVVFQDADTAVQVLEGTVNGAGSAINHVAHELGIDKHVLRKRSGEWLAALEREVLFENGVAGLGSPWWVADAGSSFAGDHAADASAEEKIAAVMESIVFMLAVNLRQMSDVAGKPGRLVVTGGLSSVDELLQKLANVSGLRVERAESLEATTRGLACLLANLPRNWPDVNVNKVFIPAVDPALKRRFSLWLEVMPSWA